MSIFPQIENFLLSHCHSSSPLLLALSGGPDSLCLFYALLIFRKKHGISFHIAHVNHNWREESLFEAHTLEQLASKYQIPFHLKTLDLSILQGNLEDSCREERYLFFADLCCLHQCQSVLTGHHQGDQAETIFKRIFEGAHWSRWTGLKGECWIKGVRILRPLLTISKKEILKALDDEKISSFEDPTNQDPKFLRARLRQTIFPRLNQEFGKEIESSLIAIGEEAFELTNYFQSRFDPLFHSLIRGPWGIYLDLQQKLPVQLIEVKYLIRLLSQKEQFFLSREIIEQIAQALVKNKAGKQFMMKNHHIWVDRRRLFILNPLSLSHKDDDYCFEIKPGIHSVGKWILTANDDTFSFSHIFTCWKEGWMGHLRTYLPLSYDYQLVFKNEKSIHVKKIKKKWLEAKIPSFLSSIFPLIMKNETIYHEFLTGRILAPLKEGDSCWKIEITYFS